MELKYKHKEQHVYEEHEKTIPHKKKLKYFYLYLNVYYMGI